MRKYHLSALNLFWRLSPLSSLCTGSPCDNTNAGTQTGNNSSPNGGPSDLGFASLTRTLAQGGPRARTTSPSLLVCLQIGENKRGCQKHKHTLSLSLAAPPMRGTGCCCPAYLPTADPRKNSVVVSPPKWVHTSTAAATGRESVYWAPFTTSILLWQLFLFSRDFYFPHTNRAKGKFY